ncbi:MAG TPA: di-trans,poly-cis-decaprenylcistransferase [Gemmatimonadales bacterium]|jgi:undecaprenyl diphosphate synthase|nr:di-trans,poly-cis-decaprenylcistransferase [Gemmatimonadales bacterium]
MKPSTPSPSAPSGLHVAIIMDGNGRWATRQGKPRSAGHREGAEVVQRIVEVAPDLGVGTLTLFAFSADNWQRPAREVKLLMRLFAEYLRAEAARCVSRGVRLTVLGRRDRLSPSLLSAIDYTESATSGGTRLLLRLAIDYSARDAILRAAQCLSPDNVLSRESFSRLLTIVDHGGPHASPVDLLIRTGGERRLSDFLLWESAYAELCFTPVMWPDFGPDHLRQAVRDFHGRERRFGGLPDAAAS